LLDDAYFVPTTRPLIVATRPIIRLADCQLTAPAQEARVARADIGWAGAVAAETRQATSTSGTRTRRMN
jgi:hypothetical protein